MTKKLDYFPDSNPNVTCKYCYRPLITDLSTTQPDREIHEKFSQWIFADLKNRIEYIDDLMIIYIDDQPCHEKCHYQEKEGKGNTIFLIK